MVAEEPEALEEPTTNIRITPEALERGRHLAIEAARLASDRHCSDIVVLELADRSPIATHFVIATGTSNQQIRAVAQEIADYGEAEKDFKVYNQAGLQDGRWVVVDFVDVIVHLFDGEFRNFYDLELLWGDAPKIEWERPGAPSS